MKFSLLVAVLVIISTPFLVSWGKQPPIQPLVNNNNMPSNGNPYEDLRNKALHITAKELGIIVPTDKTTIYGVVMDWAMGTDVITLVSYQTGDVSLYFSNGGGYIGGGAYVDVSNAAKAYIFKAQDYLSKATTTTETPLPDKDCIRFYLLATDGIHTALEHVENMDNGKSPWLDLFNDANKVITEFRSASNK